MADSGTQLGSFLGGEFQDGGFPVRGFEIFLDDHVHGMEGIKHLVCRVHDPSIFLLRKGTT